MFPPRLMRFGRLLALAALAAAASGCTIFNNLLAEKRDVYEFDHSFGVADPAFRRSLDSLGTVMIAGNQAAILENGNEIFPAMLAAIENAKVSVNLETYLFTNDPAGIPFAKALEAAAARGVEVRVLVDGVGDHLGPLTDEMISAGVRLHTYRPVRLFTIYKIGKRTHRKILVVDGNVCFTGGVGIDARWLGDGNSPGHWRDTQVKAEGPVVSQMQAIFGEDWTYTTGEILAGDKFYPKLPPAGSMLAQAIKVARGDDTSLAKMLFYVAIQAAEKSIFIENAYFLPDKQVREALIRAVARGVDVEILVPGRHIDLPYVRYASRLHYGDMLAGGVRIFEYTPTMLHSKTMVVDSLFSTIGSINFDARSMQKNAEVSLAVYNAEFASKMEEMFASDLGRGREVTLTEYRHRGLFDRISELVFWIWEPYY